LSELYSGWALQSVCKVKLCLLLVGNIRILLNATLIVRCALHEMQWERSDSKEIFSGDAFTKGKHRTCLTYCLHVMLYC